MFAAADGDKTASRWELERSPPPGRRPIVCVWIEHSAARKGLSMHCDICQSIDRVVNLTDANLASFFFSSV
jgi:hypothetical protein